MDPWLGLVSPSWLLLLAALVWMAYALGRRRRLPALAWGSLAQLPPAPKSLRLRLVGLPAALWWTGLSAWVIALAGPVRREPLTFVKDTPRGFVFVVDVSGSMGALAPTPDWPERRRLDAAKQVIQAVVQRQVGEQFALVVFSRRARLACPLTEHADAFLALVNRLEIDVVENRTNLGDAVALAIAVAQSAPRGAVVVVSDGASNVSDGMPVGVAARTAQALGVPIHVVSLAAKAGGPDARNLSALADWSGGQTFSAAGPDAFLQTLHQLQGLAPAADNQAWRFRDLRRPWLLLALTFVIISEVLRRTWLNVTTAYERLA